MVRRAQILSAVLLTVGFAGTAQAQAISAQDRADARCFLAMHMLRAKAMEAGTELSAADNARIDAIAIYFVGKVRGRHPVSTSIAAMLPVETVKDVAANAAKEAGPCIAESKQYATDLGVAGPIIQEASRQLNAEAAALDAENEKLEAEIARRKAAGN